MQPSVEGWDSSSVISRSHDEQRSDPKPTTTLWDHPQPLMWLRFNALCWKKTQQLISQLIFRIYRSLLLENGNKHCSEPNRMWENVLIGGKKSRDENYPNQFKTSSNSIHTFISQRMFFYSSFHMKWNILKGFKRNLLFYFNMTLWLDMQARY